MPSGSRPHLRHGRGWRVAEGVVIRVTKGLTRTTRGGTVAFNSALGMTADPSPTEPVPATSTVGVLIAHADWIVRAGLRSLLDSGSFNILAEVRSGRAAVAEAERLRPDVAVIDFRLPDVSAPEVCRAIRRAVPGVVVLVLGVSGHGQLIHDSLRAGARGYLIQDEALDLADAIHRALRGERVLDADATASLIDSLAEEGPDGVRLTNQELQILRLAAQGFTNREIGAQLFLSRYTVKDHVSRAMHKLGVRTRIAAVVEATRRGLLDPDQRPETRLLDQPSDEPLARKLRRASQRPPKRTGP
jgi:DNA-binding NarL/FixJ family response regulator